MLRRFRLILYHLRLLPELLRVHRQIKQLHPDTQLFCFFPFYQTGGSEQVHADIVQAVGPRYSREQIAIFFTKVSRSDTFKRVFHAAAQGIEIAALDRSAYRRYLIKKLSRVINSKEKPVVFGANATFAYELIPHLKPDIRFVDLTHSFVPESSAPVERFSLPYLTRITKRVVINQQVLDDYRTLYQSAGLEWSKWENRFCVVNNRLRFPRWDLSRKAYDTPPLNVLFVGRNSPEKRISLIGAIAQELRDSPVRFTLVGPDLAQKIQSDHGPGLHFAGEVTDQEALANLYKASHVILITSSREGFPLVLMEGMVHGCVPVTTRVGGISYHVRHQQNGLLVENQTDESELVKTMASYLLTLLNNPAYLRTLSQAAQEEACQSFDPDQFDTAWNHLLAV